MCRFFCQTHFFPNLKQLYNKKGEMIMTKLMESNEREINWAKQIAAFAKAGFLKRRL